MFPTIAGRRSRRNCASFKKKSMTLYLHCDFLNTFLLLLLYFHCIKIDSKHRVV